MACKECKKNNRFKEEMNKSTELFSKKIIVVFVVWTILGVYGLFSLISKFL
jgi:hypothetical protein